jgi:hypothetical protein
MNVIERLTAMGMIVFATLFAAWATVTYPGLYGINNILSLASAVALLAIVVFGRQFAAKNQLRWIAIIATVVVSLYEFIHTLSGLTVMLTVVVLFIAGAFAAMFADRFHKEAPSMDQLQKQQSDESSGFLESVFSPDFSAS